MTGDGDSGGRYAEGTAVQVCYPLTPGQEDGPRDDWPWVSATVLSRCGPDEWRVRVDAPELEEDGTFPVVFRDAYARPGWTVRPPITLRLSGGSRGSWRGCGLI